MLSVEALEAEVMKLADEATPELLPMLLKIFLHDDRPGLMTCERHTRHLFPYVRAQIDLTRAKRNYYRDGDYYSPCSHGGDSRIDHSAVALRRAQNIRDDIRKTYRTTPCTCWVTHR